MNAAIPGGVERKLILPDPRFSWPVHFHILARETPKKSAGPIEDLHAPQHTNKHTPLGEFPVRSTGESLRLRQSKGSSAKLLSEELRRRLMLPKPLGFLCNL
jgi:hypothetical protein